MSEPIRVLHVDDDPAVVDMAATVLERVDDRRTAETSPSESGLVNGLAPGETLGDPEGLFALAPGRGVGREVARRRDEVDAPPALPALRHGGVVP